MAILNSYVSHYRRVRMLSNTMLIWYREPDHQQSYGPFSLAKGMGVASSTCAGAAWSRRHGVDLLVWWQLRHGRKRRGLRVCYWDPACDVRRKTPSKVKMWADFFWLWEAFRKILEVRTYLRNEVNRMRNHLNHRSAPYTIYPVSWTSAVLS